MEGEWEQGVGGRRYRGMGAGCRGEEIQGNGSRV